MSPPSPLPPFEPPQNEASERLKVNQGAARTC